MNYNSSPKKFAPIDSRPHYNPDRVGEVKHIALDLVVDFESEIVHGSAETTLKILQENLNTLVLDAIDMEIESAYIDNQLVKFEYDGRQVFLYLEQTAKIDQKILIKIEYILRGPKMGLVFVKPTEFYPNKPTQIWTQGESEQSRHWYPCFDYPLQICTSEIKVEVPKEFTTISNGLLVNQKIENNRKVDHWLQDLPHPSYLMALTAGEFVEVKDTYQDLPISYYSQPKNLDLLKINGSKTPRMIEFFSQKFGVKYPWKKYFQVWIHDYIWGGMENTTATFNTERALADEKSILEYYFSEILVAHELSHQWFGDYIVIKHWSHLWIKEGAATFSEYLWTRHEKGEDEFNYYKLLETREYLDEDSSAYRRPIVTNLFRDAEDLYDRHSYSKGGLVYNMIRAELGDTMFAKALKYFLENYKHRNVDTNIFLSAIAESTGKNLSRLFDQYVFRGGHPEFKVTLSWDNQSKLAKLNIIQKQAKGDKEQASQLFNLKIPTEFRFVDESSKNLKSVKSDILVTEKEQNYFFKFNSKPDFVSFDPHSDYLKTVELNMSVKELHSQLVFDPNPVNRIFAATELAKKNNLVTLNYLSTCLREDKFWGVRAEIATQIGKINLNQSVETLINALNDSDPRVRKQIVKSLCNFHTPEVFKKLQSIASNQQESYFVQQAAIIGVGILANQLSGEYIEKGITLFKQILNKPAGWNNVVRAGAIHGLSKLNSSKEALKELVSYTKLGVSQELRMAALQTLGSALEQQDKSEISKVVEILDNASKDTYIISQKAVLNSLSKIDSVKAEPIIQYIFKTTLYGRIKNFAQDILDKKRRSQTSKDWIAKLQQELEELKKSNQDLRTKVEELEGRASEK
ncbi:MAG: M1 family aminopeptidase [Patescibacteria group bacterium]